MQAMKKFLQKQMLLTILFFLFISCKKNSTEQPSLEVQTPVYKYSNVLSPTGEKPQTLSSLKEALAKVSFSDVADKKFTVAIAMHDVKNTWSQAVLKGIKETLENYGVSIMVVSDGEFDLQKQVADIENIISMKPDLLITLPLDAEKSNTVLKKAAAAGIKLAFIDAVPNGFSQGEYVGWAVGDAYRMGEVSAEILGKEFTDSSKVILLNWKNSMFTVDQRSAGARDYFTANENITIVEEIAFTEFYEIPDLIEKSLKKHPDLNGIWTVWDTPAFEVLTTLSKLDKEIPVVTCDLSQKVADELQDCSTLLVGTGVDHPYDLGVAEALIAVSGLTNTDIQSSFTVIYAEQVTKSNVTKAWQRLYHKPLLEKK
jgi:ribose transport system substrate-binding protein